MNINQKRIINFMLKTIPDEIIVFLFMIIGTGVFYFIPKFISPKYFIKEELYKNEKLKKDAIQGHKKVFTILTIICAIGSIISLITYISKIHNK